MIWSLCASSRTRAIGLDCGVRDHIFPINSWAAYFSIPTDLLKGSKIGVGHSAVGGRFLSLKPDPSGATRVSMFNIHPRNNLDLTKPFREAMNSGDQALKKFVAHRYRDVGWRAEEAIEGMMKSDDFYASEIVQVKTPMLHNGRFVMVGDAGYAPGPSGGGTSLALAGAYVLAGEITSHPSDLEAGLRVYKERMRPIISDLQKIPPFVPGVMAPQGAWGIWIRNMIFAFIAWSGVVGYLSKYFANAFAHTDKYNLPDYIWPK